MLYVDFDGVVQPESVYFYPRLGPVLVNAPGHKLFEHVGLLEQELASYPDVRIVLSTSWVRRYRGSIPKVTRHLTPALRDRVVGATFHSRMDAREFAAAPRGVQVWADVVRRKPLDWLALDDDAERWPAWCRDKLVQTDEILGISAPGVLEELRAKLTGMVPY
ncbi:HAD domain-containing protein [Paraburkholderia mimosarum]|uniref:HAD domain-containing protein n=1 Tax=Paraburkholderia mimosarum TaxID=312026 RepID=UPI000B27639D|nr:HAD domain-containing protein [Paraburkholderia mimosarum]